MDGQNPLLATEIRSACPYPSASTPYRIFPSPSVSSLTAPAPCHRWIRAKWHSEALSGAFGDDSKRKQFRNELADLQDHLQNYAEQLRKIAGVPADPNP